MNVGNDDTGMLVVIGIGSLFLNFVVTLVTGIWALTRNNGKISADLEQKITATEREFKKNIDNTTNMFGDSLAALRQKLNDVQLWNRDNFVGKETFKLIVGEIKMSNDRLEDKIDDRFKEINVKLDALREA